MRTRTFGAPLLTLLSVLALAGCGGGSDSTGSTGGSTEAQSGSTEADESTGSAPTKAVFIKEADKICGDADDELNDELEAFAKENDIDLKSEEPTDEQQEELFQEVALPNVARQGEEIAALTPPEGDEETIEDLTDTLADEVAEAEEGGELDEDTLKGAGEKAQAYGLKTCGG